MTMQELSSELDKALTDKWAQYLDLRTLINSYSGRILNETEAVEAKKIFEAIEDTFLEIYPAINVIIYRNQWASNALAGHNDWIDILKKANLIRIEQENKA